MSTFWSLWIIVIVVVTIGGSTWLLFATRKMEVTGEDTGKAPTTGHAYDGIEEYDNPLPAWWFKMFVGTVIFGVIYLLLFPGLGSFGGLLGWTSHGKWQKEVDAAEAKYGVIYDKFAQQSIEDLAGTPEALKMGRRLFANNCAVCHGSDARGGFGFPNLTDDDWLYGGSPDKIKETLIHGRAAAMPAWGSVIGEEGIEKVAAYVFSLSGREHNKSLAEEGKTIFATYCAACHGADGKGGQAVGAPNLTDNIWLYGGSPELVKHTLRSGRNGVMPAQGEKLKANKIHLLTAYVYSLSQRPE